MKMKMSPEMVGEITELNTFSFLEIKKDNLPFQEESRKRLVR